MFPRSVLAFLPALVLTSCASREFSASIAIPVSGPGNRAPVRSYRPAPQSTFPGGASPFRVPTVTEQLPEDSESHPSAPAGGSTSTNGPASVSARPPATP